jgi:hypothetical protein
MPDDRNKRDLPDREALHNLAAALTEDVLQTPSGQLLAETAEDHGHPRALAIDFDRLIARAEHRRRKAQVLAMLRAVFVTPILALMRRPAIAALVVTLFGINIAVAYLQMAGYYDFFRANHTRDDSTPSGPASPAAEIDTPDGAQLRIRRYVEQYDGGPCFFIAALAIGPSRATIEGFGASLQPFYAFDEAFKRNLGFEADITVRQITEAQCPVPTFLAALKTEGGRAPRININSFIVRDGDAINGIIEGFGYRNVELLLVSDSGIVQNVTSFLRPGIDSMLFNFNVARPRRTPESEAQLLVAIVSATPLNAFKFSGAAAADQVFPAAFAETQSIGQTVAASARYFSLSLAQGAPPATAPALGPAPALAPNIDHIGGALKQVAEVCSNIIRGKYPFVRGSATDLALEDFGRLFGAGGILDQFFKLQLEPFVDRSGAEWAWKPGTSMTGRPSNILRSFQTADWIKDSFEMSTGTLPMLKLSIQPAQVPAGVTAEFKTGGTTVQSPATGTAAVPIEWPGTSVRTAIAVNNGPGIGRDGIWSLFRMLEAGGLRASGETATVQYLFAGIELHYQIRTGSVKNPLDLGRLREFRCPE